MLLHLLFSVAVARGAEVVSIRPTAPAPTLHYRETLRAFLRTPRYRSGVKALGRALGAVRGATAIHIALEEVQAYTGEWRAKTAKIGHPAVVHRVFEELSTIQIGTVTESERQSMRALLEPYVDRYYENRKAANGFYHAVLLYDRLGPRGPQDLKYLIEDIRTMPYLIGAYQRILAIAPTLGEVEATALRNAILANPGKAIMRWAVLDEIGLLPPEFLRGGIDMLMHEMLPASRHESSEQEMNERRVLLRALERWQTRYRAEEPVMVATVDAAALAVMKREHLEGEGRFVSRFVRGLLPTEPTYTRLIARDPLGLSESSTIGNVVPFNCNVRLQTVVAPL